MNKIIELPLYRKYDSFSGMGLLIPAELVKEFQGRDAQVVVTEYGLAILPCEIPSKFKDFWLPSIIIPVVMSALTFWLIGVCW